jgi:hypothetical protein
LSENGNNDDNDDNDNDHYNLNKSNNNHKMKIYHDLLLIAMQGMDQGYLYIRSTKPLTVPQEFHFASDDVLNKRKAEKIRSALLTAKSSSITHVKKNEDGSLKIVRKTNTAFTSAMGRVCIEVSLSVCVTSIQVNKLVQAAKKSSRPFVSMAEQINKFFSTPQRFHSKNPLSDTFQPVANVELKSTVPISPNFATDARARPLPV